MANKRNKKKLNSKQANRISLIISTVYFIYTLVNGVISKPIGDQAVYYWVMGCAIGTILIYFVFYYMIFKGDDRKFEERAKEMEIVTAQYLSYTDFKQVYFGVTDDGSHIDMMNKILQKEECKFYAKLIENNNIYLIVKDKHNEEVFSEEIENHVYFNHNFKFKE